MYTESLGSREAIEGAIGFELRVSPLEEVHSAKAGALLGPKPELIFVDCAGLCEE